MNKCKRCNKFKLKKKNYGMGLISYCSYCKVYFNKEGEFINEGGAYWDVRYTKGYWIDMAIKTCCTGLVSVLLSFAYRSWVLYTPLIIPLIYVIIYPIFKWKNYFIED